MPGTMLLLVFGGFVNRRLRKISRDLLQASREWNPEAYCKVADRYLQAVEEDIRRTEMAQPLSEEQIRGSMEGWRGVLAEHPGAFEAAPLEHIAKEINRIILWHDSEEAVLNGDGQ